MASACCHARLAASRLPQAWWISPRWRGVGRFAVESVAAEIRRRDSTQMYFTWEPGEDGPEGFYWKLGFQLTAEKSEGQTVGVLDLTNP